MLKTFINLQLFAEPVAEPDIEEEIIETEEAEEETEYNEDFTDLDSDFSEEDVEEDTEEGEVGQGESQPEENIADLKAQLKTEREKREKMETLSKQALKKFGIEVNGNIEDALDAAAAEVDGVTVEEYRKKRTEEEELEQARQIVRMQEYEKSVANDLTELKRHFPALLNKSRMQECFESNELLIKFGKLKDAGIDAKTAYLAVCGDKFQVQIADATRQRALAQSEGKRHIQSAVPKQAVDTSIQIPKEILYEWRELHPDKSDKEIAKLYRDTKN